MADEAFLVPDEFALVGFFGAEPVERSVDHGYWCYEMVDARNIRLRFSFDIFEQSVQTALQIADSPLVTIVHEGAGAMKIEDRSLTCSSMKTAHARIRWLRPDEGGRATPPPGPVYSTVARFERLAARWPQEAWSVALKLKEPPDAEGRMTVEVRMLVDGAPEGLLAPGSVFELFEGPQCVASGEVLQEQMGLTRFRGHRNYAAFSCCMN